MGMLTASDAASAIGVNKYETPHQLLLKKCGKGPVFTGNEATDTVKNMKTRRVYFMNKDITKLFMN